ncbi:hypothetical protein ACU8KH_05249 [Lachancea thermotolerans]
MATALPDFVLKNNSKASALQGSAGGSKGRGDLSTPCPCLKSANSIPIAATHLLCVKQQRAL